MRLPLIVRVDPNLAYVEGDRPRVLLGVGFDGIASSAFCRARAEEQYALSKTRARRAQCYKFRREPDVSAPLRISIDESRRSTVSKREQAPIAGRTPQQQMITEALEKVIAAINQADVSEPQRNEAKSLLRKLLGSKAAASVLGAHPQSLAAKYFTD